MNLRDTAERLVWTLVAAFLGALAVGDLIDVTALDAAIAAAAGAGVNFLLLVARARLAVLPEPGAGLPGLPTEPPVPEVNERLRELGIYDDEPSTRDAGQANVSGVLWVIFLLLAIIVLLRVLGVV